MRIQDEEQCKEWGRVSLRTEFKIRHPKSRIGRLAGKAIK